METLTMHPDREKRKSPSSDVTESFSKKLKVDDEVIEVSDSPEITKKEFARLEKQKQKELERLEKERKKEEERAEKERKKEEERLEKERKKEEERLKKEEERLEKERKKEEEKEAKRKKLLEEKLERERKREEEKEKKQAERDQLKLEKKRKLEEEKERKEIERKKAEEEKKKAEERNQMKISSFFQIGRKKEPESLVIAKEITDSSTEVSDYDKEFLPFFVQKNVVMAPPTQLSEQELAKAVEDFDKLILNKEPLDSLKVDQNLEEATQQKSITPEHIITALNLSNTTESQIYTMLKQIPPIKYISFYENSKPPYIGTWCSERHQSIRLPVANPINTSLTGLDYEYDSDLEWNKEDEEGEDLENDEDEEDDEMINDDDDIEDFVENNADGQQTKKFHSLVVINKWNDGSNDEIFDQLTTTVCVEVPFPLNPTYDYWGINKSKDKASDKDLDPVAKKLVSTTLAEAGSASPNILIPQKKIIKDETVLKGLVEFIEKNSDFTIGTLVELSKKEFKDFTKGLLKNTIQDMATYNKKTFNWEIKQEAKEKYQ